MQLFSHSNTSFLFQVHSFTRFYSLNTCPSWGFNLSSARVSLWRRIYNSAMSGWSGQLTLPRLITYFLKSYHMALLFMIQNNQLHNTKLVSCPYSQIQSKIISSIICLLVQGWTPVCWEIWTRFINIFQF